jgi:hypothetical protein
VDPLNDPILKSSSMIEISVREAVFRRFGSETRTIDLHANTSETIRSRT